MTSRPAPRRRIGSETSQTRDRLLAGVEHLMLDQGYAAVTYRAVAAKAGVTPALVQYYFPTLDDLFLASIRRYTERNVERLAAALDARGDQPMRAIWEYSRDESSAALMMEYMALGNHRRSIRSEIAKVTKRVQRVQLDALKKREAVGGKPRGDEPSAEALLFFLTGVPKLMQLFEGLGISTGHDDVVRLFERYLDASEPRTTPARRKPREERSRRRS